MVVCTPSKLVPFQRLSHSLAFLPGPVGQIVPKGSPLTRPQVAPPVGLQLYSPERLSLPESNACTPQREQLYRGSEDSHIHTTHLKQIKAQKVRTKTNTCDPSSTSSCVNWVVNSKIRCWPVAVISVVFGSWIDHRTSLHANLLEQVPHLLIDVLLKIEGKKMCKSLRIFTVKIFITGTYDRSLLGLSSRLSPPVLC